MVDLGFRYPTVGDGGTYTVVLRFAIMIFQSTSASHGNTLLPETEEDGVGEMYGAR